jgi:hypothetical protein
MYIPYIHPLRRHVCTFKFVRTLADTYMEFGGGEETMNMPLGE